MKSNAIVSALVAMSLAMGGPVFGQGDGDERARAQAQRQAQRQSQRQFPQADPPRAQRPRATPPQSQRGYQQQPRQRNFEQQRPPPGYGQPGQRGGPYQDERGAGPDRQYHRGDRLPQEYRHPNYVVNNWRDHNLSPPPRGYHWVQTGADYVLVAIATGIILQLLLNN